MIFCLDTPTFVYIFGSTVAILVTAIFIFAVYRLFKLRAPTDVISEYQEQLCEPEDARISFSEKIVPLDYVELDYLDAADRTMDSTIISFNNTHLSTYSMNTSNNIDSYHHEKESFFLNSMKIPSKCFKEMPNSTRKRVPFSERLNTNF
uniref:Uncharacterized protein n=1 Tax=Parastrongyloides trichosuri TaxID=131310 RepID=A0A0N4ZR97_PARTI